MCSGPLSRWRGCDSTNGFIHPCIFRSAQDVYLETGYLRVACDASIAELGRLPRDGRNFYQLLEGAAQLIVRDVDNVFLPSPSDLLANLSNCRKQVVNMLFNLLVHFNSSQEADNGLGAALQAA